MRRRHLLAAPLALPVILNAKKLAAREPHDFSFAFITDCHIQPELSGAEACRKCFRDVARGPFDFVIQGGDHVYDALEVGRERAQRLMDIYVETEQTIGLKIHHVIGNHDCWGVFPTSGVTPSASGYGKEYYKERFGPTYYSFDHKDVHFIVLDSIGLTGDRSYEGRVDAAQLRWMEGDLAKLSPNTRIIVVSHIPLVTALGCYEPLSWTHTPHNWTSVANSREVLERLHGSNVIAVLQGHSHVAETVMLNNIPFITGGAVSGNWWQGRFLGTAEGYMHITVRGHEVTAHYLGYGFNALHPKDVEI